MTRGELYEAVWQRPLSRVASELQVSDSCLRLVCAREEIPVPGRGHWAKVMSSFPVPPRPALKGNRDQTVSIRKERTTQPTAQSQAGRVLARAEQLPSEPLLNEHSLAAESGGAHDSNCCRDTGCKQRTLAELMAAKNLLDQEIAAASARERVDAVTRVLNLMAEHQLGLADLQAALEN